MGACEHFQRDVQSNRNPRRSDAGDLFHLVHLPYCDLFRADANTAETAKPLGLKWNTVIVPKLQDLPGQIEVMLRKKRTMP